MAPMPRNTAPRNVISWADGRPAPADADGSGVVDTATSLTRVRCWSQRYSGTGSGAAILSRCTR